MNLNRFAALLSRPAGLAAALLLTACGTSPGPAPPDCSDAARFELALVGDPVSPACSVVAPDEAYGLGEMIRERRETIERATSQLETAPAPSRREQVRLRQSLIRAQRDLPELEALARLEGWMPPAELPDK